MISTLAVGSPAYALGNFFGYLFVAILIFAVLRALFGGANFFSSRLKYIILALALITGGIVLAIYLRTPNLAPVAARDATRTNSQVPQPATVAVEDPELERLLRDAQQQYLVLEKIRSELDTKNAKAVEAFNEQAAAYKELLARIEARRKALLSSATPRPR